jgi:putative membrane protein
MFNGFCHFGNWGYFGSWGWAGMILSMAIWIALLAVVILLVIWAVRRSSASAVTASGQPTAREILQARYARGEISREEYQQMLKDLS